MTTTYPYSLGLNCTASPSFPPSPVSYQSFNHCVSVFVFHHNMASGGIGNFAGDGANAGRNRPIKPQERLLHDSAVTFDEYHYYAEKTRAEEGEASRVEIPRTGILQIMFPPKNGPSAVHTASEASPPGGDCEKRQGSVTSNTNLARRDLRLAITDEEWTNASRAMRTATWAACFYLITTDIFGPFGVG